VVLALLLAVGVVVTAALRPAPVGALAALVPLLDLPLDRVGLLAVLAVQVAAVAWWRTWPVPALAVATAASAVLAITGANHVVAEFGVYGLICAVGARAAKGCPGPRCWALWPWRWPRSP
jgi:hypothetical protein